MSPTHCSPGEPDQRLREPDERSARIIRGTRRAGMFFLMLLAGLALFLLVQPLSSLLIETWKQFVASVYR